MQLVIWQELENLQIIKLEESKRRRRKKERFKDTICELIFEVGSTNTCYKSDSSLHNGVPGRGLVTRDGVKL